MQTTPSLKGFLPEQAPRRYKPVGRCIYCQATDGLTDEHIVPLGLGGQLLLPKASCRRCNEWTSKAERTCMRTMYGPLRLLYDLPTRRPSDRPATLALKVKRSSSSEWESAQVAQGEYPFLILFPQMEEPGAINGVEMSAAEGPAERNFWIRGASPSYDFNALLERLCGELRVHSVMPEARHDMPAFCRVLSKIAYAYAVAELGFDIAKSPVARLATDGDLSHCRYFIGGTSGQEPPRNVLHELSIHFFPMYPRPVVRLRLLAKLGTPAYLVAL